MENSLAERDDTEEKTADLYGKIFPAISQQDFEKFLSFVSTSTLRENTDYFQGKTVLDLGCGGLGYAIAGFIQQGAAAVTGIDLSAENIARLQSKFQQYPHVKLIQHDICHLEDLDLETPDLVYSNGVIHATKAPEKVVADAYRLLKPGGKIVIGLYGKGGIIPFLITLSRTLGRVIPQKVLEGILKAVWPTSIFYIMDYVYVPIQIRYTEQEAVALLTDAGFQNVGRLPNPHFEDAPVRRALMQTQSDPDSFMSRLLHGHGFIIVKGVK